MGTKRKMKRVMSGGRGKISKYTQKFKRSYNRFVKIGDNDDVDSRFKKMEEWGRMRNIYKFLKIQNDKYKGSAGTETTAWEKMNDNDDYKSAISCFEQSDNRILSEGDKCIPEEDYMKGDTGAPDADVVAIKDPYASNADNNADNNEAPAPTVDDNTENAAGETEATPKDPYASNDAETPPPVTEDSSTPSDVSNDAETPVSDDAVDAPVGDAENDNDAEATAPTVDDTASQATTTDADNTENAAGETEANPEVSSAPEAPAPEADADAVGQPEADAEKQDGGRSKRKPRSSRRRRGKSMKSKKGRKTRRKHRAGRH